MFKHAISNIFSANLQQIEEDCEAMIENIISDAFLREEGVTEVSTFEDMRLPTKGAGVIITMNGCKFWINITRIT